MRVFTPPGCLARLYTTKTTKSIYVEKRICSKKFFAKSLTVLKTVEQCRKHPSLYLNTLNRTIPYLNKLNRTITYLNKLNRTIPYLNTLSRIIPYLNTLNPILLHYRRQPIKFDYYVTRVVIQSESSITSPESSRFGWRSHLGSWLESARYSLF